MGLKKNLYYEIQDRIVEEKQDGVHAYKQKIRTKVYGLNSTKAIRNQLIDILIERVESHKDKIISPIIYNEIIGMEVKRGGKVEHSNTTHDDQVFSMLMALYMWYEGVNMAERFGLKKTSIKTDDDIDEEADYYNDDTVELVGFFNDDSDIVQEEIQHDLNAAIKAGGTPMNEFLEKQRAAERAQFENLVSTPLGERAYRQTYNIPDGLPITNYVNSDPNFTIPNSVFYGFYNPTDSTYQQRNAGINPHQGAVPESQAMLLNDDEYKYTDHFNF